MLRLRPARPDLCQHDSGLLRLHHLLWDLVSLPLVETFMFVVDGVHQARSSHRCGSWVCAVHRWLGGTVSSLASVKVRTGNVDASLGSARGRRVGPGSVDSLLCLQHYFSEIRCVVTETLQC